MQCRSLHIYFLLSKCRQCSILAACLWRDVMSYITFYIARVCVSFAPLSSSLPCPVEFVGLLLWLALRISLVVMSMADERTDGRMNERRQQTHRDSSSRRKKTIKNDEEGHLIYKEGDILNERCTHPISDMFYLSVCLSVCLSVSDSFLNFCLSFSLTLSASILGTFSTWHWMKILGSASLD